MKKLPLTLALVVLPASLAHTGLEGARKCDGEPRAISEAARIAELGPGEAIRCPTDTDHRRAVAPGADMAHRIVAGDLDGGNVFRRGEAAEGQQHARQEELMPKEQMHFPAASQEPVKGPEDWFTGDVEIRPLFPANGVAHYSGAYVTFQPGARTAWHFHPAGQHMIVTAGVGLTGTRDGKIIEFTAGDAIWCPPDIDHWHGATPDAAMTHLVITGDLDGKNVVWKEKVTDEQYDAKRE